MPEGLDTFPWQVLRGGAYHREAPVSTASSAQMLEVALEADIGRPGPSHNSLQESTQQGRPDERAAAKCSAAPPHNALEQEKKGFPLPIPQSILPAASGLGWSRRHPVVGLVGTAEIRRRTTSGESGHIKVSGAVPRPL
ncbi:hypothetical protein NDU88_002973 [Pleurodeles waltl]|uniref:Uncharacterized protein n=1 Tax=Pleurodeles waltl TaxID=8319 RepID=A0AAV7UYR6_PLEWA|nr:hypothetical protein NDU88_002973 [Pleurodeles waltl]